MNELTNLNTNQISPRPWLAFAVILIGCTFCLIYIPAGLAVVTFGVFLLIQTAILQLHFEADSLVIKQKILGKPTKEIRNFPYKDWQYWQIYFSKIPILFYFREFNSIHFLPMLFAAEELKEHLKLRIGPSGKIEIAEPPEASSPQR
jgi:hypothetical protein